MPGEHNTRRIWAVGVRVSFVSTGVSKGKESHACNNMGIYGGP